MAILGFTRDDLGSKINKVLSSAHPIDTPEKLKGRDELLEEIARLLYMDGRSVFIYGDRGVGKSSLGATAAFQYQTSDKPVIAVGGALNETFNSIVANIANQALGSSRTYSVKKTSNVGFEWRGLKWSLGREVSQKSIIDELNTIGDAVDLLAEVASVYAEKPIVLLDEFDAIPDVAERNLFAALLKALGDRGVNLKFIFTGVGRSLEQLLGAHLSAQRQIVGVEVPRLGWNARLEIVTEAAKHFDLGMDNNVKYRIGIISDGFPAYIHLITEEMLWQAFDDSDICGELGSDHYLLGLRKAIGRVTMLLRKPYEDAVLHRDDEMEDVVWSTADSEDTARNVDAMYKSYLSIAETRERSPVDRSRYAELLRRLRTAGYGAILESVEKRAGWYVYKEKMLRGYVRMQAEANGVELHGEMPSQRQRMTVPSNVRTGYYGSMPPKGTRWPRN
ncbi:ATP-binding protein [Burkholderia gladioli]|uniref:ATP-binding protein n=1 Tax=Burkholderia gladioli TaxID=28095 RepID=UPI00164214CF|nr:ATP-binding protein [Burkholderia gladioli]